MILWLSAHELRLLLSIVIVNPDMVWKLGELQSVYDELRFYVELASPCTNILKFCLLDPVYTAPDPHGHDIKLNSSTTSVALTPTIVLQNLTTSSHRKSGESKYDRKLPELDVVTNTDQGNPVPCKRGLNISTLGLSASARQRYWMITSLYQYFITVFIVHKSA